MGGRGEESWKDGDHSQKPTILHRDAYFG